MSAAIQAHAGTAQTIAFPAIANHGSTDAPFALGATASSGLNVTYSITSTSSGSIATLSGGTASLTGTTGSVTVKASQPGNATYDPAPDVYRSFVVRPAGQHFTKLPTSMHGIHAGAIDQNGALWMWGNNHDGQLGDNYSAEFVPLPKQIGSATTWTALSCGVSHTLGLRNGSLFAAGLNSSGQLGDGSTTLRVNFAQIGSSTTWATVAAGQYHSMALRNDGSLWAWGENSNGQLGLGNLVDRTAPVRVGTSTWLAVACGWTHTLAVRSDGTLWAWGNNGYYQLGDGSFTSRNAPVQISALTTWTTVSAGLMHSMARRSDGSLWVWGFDQYGQVGIGSSATTPQKLDNNLWATTLSGGSIHSLGLRQNGTLWGWGGNTTGQVGNGSLTNSILPGQIGTTTTWTAILGGYDSSLALRSDGSLWTWGNNDRGQLARGSLTPATGPVMLAGGDVPVWTEVASGTDFSAAVKTNGTLWTWGNSVNGRLGDGSSTDRTAPQQAGTATTWTRVSTGDAHAAALRADGSLWAWGAGTNGRLGTGSTADVTTPVQIAPGSTWTSVACGGSHTAALYHNGTLWAWGSNNSGQLGDGTSSQRTSPVQIGSATTWAALAAGGNHTCALRTDGTLWAWGRNDYGQLGDGTTSNRNSPVQIGAGSTWLRVACGQSHTLALRSDGSLWAWGYNASGQLGDGTTTNRTSPVRIGTATGWAGISATATATRSWAVRREGTLWAWGSNDLGQLGDGTTTQRTSPVQIGTATNWAAPAGATSYTLARRTDGTLWGWGESPGTIINAYGDTTVPVSAVPQPSAQSLTFPALPALFLGQPVTLPVITASSGLPAIVTVAGPATLVGNVLTPTGAGTISIAAYQQGNESWRAAEPLMQTQVLMSQLALSGNGLPIPSGDSTPRTTDHTYFGIVDPAGATLTRTFTLANMGNAVLTCGSFFFSGPHAAEFSLTAAPAPSLAPGATTTFQVTFDPAGLDLRQTVLTFTSNDPDLLSFSFALHGYGLNPAQTVAFPALADHLATDAPFTLSATATSELPVTFTLVSSPGVASLSGSTLTLSGTPGSVTVKATQPGGGPYLPAQEVYRTFVVLDPAQRFVKLAPGPVSSHSAGIRADGTLWLWGDNTYGQLGDGTTTSRGSPIQVGTATDWTSVACGLYHTIARRANGTLWAWGSNTNGQLGIGSTTSSLVPLQVGTATSWVVVACGGNHSMALRTDGTLWAWGHNGSGQLGIGSSTSSLSPMQVGPAANWASVSCGHSHSLALRTDGTLWAWGRAMEGQLGTGGQTSLESPAQVGTASGWASASCGYYHSMGLRADGTLWGWGDNYWGQVGIGTTTGSERTPAQVGAATLWSSVACGSQFTTACAADGTLWAWGNNLAFQIGDGTQLTRTSPTQVGTATGWASSSGGSTHALALTSTGMIWGWGGNGSGQLGNGSSSLGPSTTPVSTSTWTQVAGGENHTVAVRSDGTLWGWGSNVSSQLGLGSGVRGPRAPVQIGSLATWAQVTGGSTITAALHTDGSLWAWGSNIDGAVGNGTVVSPDTPVKIGTAAWTSISTRGTHTAGIQADGTLWSWGDNSNAQVGDGTTTDRAAPVKIGTDTNWARVACGSFHTAALGTDGWLYTWGLNTSGQVGNGTTTQRTTPLFIPPNHATDRWTDVACGQYHTLARRADGTLWAWGSNAYNQIGDGTSTNRTSPKQVGTGTTWESIACGDSHSVARRADGTLWAWGRNDHGQLGDGTTTDRSFPVQITGPASPGWATVSCGYTTTYARRLDGTLWTWGNNELGQLGTQNFTVPSRTWAPATAQPITFPTLPALVIGSPVTLAATSASGLPITYTVIGPATLAGNVLTPTGTNSIILTAYQNGDESWLPATPVAQTAQATPPVPEIEVRGNGIVIANNDNELFSTNHTDFGGVLTTSGTLTRTFAIHNIGTGVLTLGTPGFSGSAQFTLTTAPAVSVAPGSSSSFTITFDPAVDGGNTAWVTFSTSDADEGTFSFLIKGTGLTPHQAWRNTHFGVWGDEPIAADTADVDNDGLTNLVEYAFGLSPVSGSSTQLPQPQRTANAFTVTFAEPAGITGLTYGASYSPSLLPGSWRPMTDTGSGTTHIFSVPLTTETKLFIRLEVTAP